MFGRFTTVCKQAYSGWQSNKSARAAAALAFYSLFAMAPLLVTAIEIAALILGHGHTKGHESQVTEALVRELEQILGQGSAKTAADLIQSTVQQQGLGLISSLFSWILFLVAAGNLFDVLRDSLNATWKVSLPPSPHWHGKIWARTGLFLLTVTLALLLLLSLVCSAVLTTFSAYFERWLPETQVIFGWVNQFLGLGLQTLLIAILFKFVPNTKIAWGPVWKGSCLTSFLWMIGQSLLNLYVTHFSVSSTFGVAGSSAILLLWIYYSAQIFLLGAEFTYVLNVRSIENQVSHKPLELARSR